MRTAGHLRPFASAPKWTFERRLCTGEGPLLCQSPVASLTVSSARCPHTSLVSLILAWLYQVESGVRDVTGKAEQLTEVAWSGIAS
jgi:hypothetical protein